MEYTNFPGDTPNILYLFHSAIPSPIQIYAIIGLGIFVSEKEMYVTIVRQLGIFVLKNYTWPLPRSDPEGWADTSKILKKTKSTFKCIAKLHANFIENYFSLFYINALRISNSFADVMSSLYMLLASILS